MPWTVTCLYSYGDVVYDRLKDVLSYVCTTDTAMILAQSVKPIEPLSIHLHDHSCGLYI
jgi:hypothetical protein